MDKFLLEVPNKDIKRKSLKHSLSIFIVNFLFQQVSVQGKSNGSYVTAFLNRVSVLESSCLLRDGFNLAMKNASKFLRVVPSFGATNEMLPKKECSLHSQRDVLIYCQQNYVLTNALQHYEWFHQCKFLHNCKSFYKFCMTDVNYDH